MRRQVSVLTTALCLAIAACGGDDTTTDSGPPPDTAAVSGDTALGETTAPSAPADPMPVDSAMAAGVTYRLGRGAFGRAAEFTNTVDGAFGLSGSGAVGVSADRLGSQPLVTVFALDGVRTFIDPLSDLGQLGSSSQLDDATVAAPADFLGHFAQLPGMTAGDVTTTEFGGFPAETVSYEVGDLTGGAPCFGSDVACLLSLYSPAGIVATYVPGDSGTMSVVDVDGVLFVVDVAARDGAAEIAASFVIGD